MHRMLLRPRPFLALASLTGLGAAGSLPVEGLEVSHAEGAISAQRVAAKPFPRRRGAARISGEPHFTREQVLRNDGVDGRPMWVTYRDGVYDVTKFHEIHPGGNLIKQAAGSDVSLFWDYWGHHHHAPSVGKYLEKLRIGSLKKEDQIDGDTMGEDKKDDPYSAEPPRERSLHTIFAERPFCSETPKDVLKKEGYLTSADALYVRNHAPVPDCAWVPEGESETAYSNNYEVTFEARGNNEDGASASMTIGELKARYGTETVTSILQCAGNRASEDIAATGPNGFTGTVFETITLGMCGNGEWTGIPLCDILPALFPVECKAALDGGGEEYHVVFEGADGYSSSTPLARVLKRENGCLLVTKMNGKPLSPDHGYPLRAFVPGNAGARSVKWLEVVSLQKSPVDAPWNSYYYKDAAASQIHDLPLQSLILGAQKVKNESKTVLSVTGVAYGGGSGNSIAKVEVSVDDGENWIEATLKAEEKAGTDQKHRDFGWVRWEAELPMQIKQVCCRATDSASQTQPRISPKQRGYLFNGWSKLEIEKNE